jgi:hypothetical protein
VSSIRVELAEDCETYACEITGLRLIYVPNILLSAVSINVQQIGVVDRASGLLMMTRTCDCSSSVVSELKKTEVCILTYHKVY